MSKKSKTVKLRKPKAKQIPKAIRLGFPNNADAYESLKNKKRQYRIKATGQIVSKRDRDTALRGMSNEDYVYVPDNLKKQKPRGGRNKLEKNKVIKKDQTSDTEVFTLIFHNEATSKDFERIDKELKKKKFKDGTFRLGISITNLTNMDLHTKSGQTLENKSTRIEKNGKMYNVYDYYYAPPIFMQEFQDYPLFNGKIENFIKEDDFFNGDGPIDFNFLINSGVVRINSIRIYATYNEKSK